MTALQPSDFSRLLTRILLLICAVPFAVAFTTLLTGIFTGQYVPEQVLSFQTGAKQNENIYLLETGRNFLRPLTYFANVSIDSYEWHPDGNSVILSARNLETPTYNLYRLSVHGELQRLSSETTWDLNPRWSPDGTKIAFVSSRGSGLKLYIMDADGNNVHLVSRSQVNAWDFDWSPDSTTLAAIPQNGVVLIDLSGDRPSTRRLVNLPGFESHPRWSSDGASITFSAGDSLYRVDVASGTTQQIRTESPDASGQNALAKRVAQVYTPQSPAEANQQEDIPVIRPNVTKLD